MKHVFTLLGLVLLASTAQANSITTIQLSNRPAEEIIPIVKPMLGTGDAISGQGFKIFLRSSAQTRAQVREMIDALDVAAKLLQISVFQGSTRGLRALDIDGGIRVESGDASVEIGNGKNKESTGSITFSTNRGSASINSTGTRSRLQDNPLHQVRVSEGSEAFIETGKQIPYFSGAYWTAPGTISGGIEYKNVTTGFYVLPRVQGDHVMLQVSPFKNSMRNAGGGSIETGSANTTITGPVGEWLLIGGTTEEITRKQSGTGSYTSIQGRSNHSIWIRADLVQ
ncbi:MAG: hypothetical protein OEU50_03405 [Gammaproteobacteria bacterium]|nr:hypothetical protein [Gammaproteobacteria bacterium]